MSNRNNQISNGKSKWNDAADRPTVVIVADSFAERMGYIGNLLPKALAKAGANVHVVTTPVSAHYLIKGAASSYGNFNRVARKAGDVVDVDGFRIHYLPYRMLLGRVLIRGLKAKLSELRPDAVQQFSHVAWTPMQLALARMQLGFAHYTGCHTTASVFPLASGRFAPWHPKRIANVFTRWLPGRVVSYGITRCYGATRDCSEVAEWMGVPRDKISTVPLGVDTDIFHPLTDTAQREQLRADRGFEPDEIICVYTGRFTVDKNPLLLAQAVAMLRSRGLRYRSLFVGDGLQKTEIAAQDGAVVLPFVPFEQLSRFFWLSDVGVWPTQESMSMIDAAACGLPIVVNDTLRAVERIDGNGLTYKLNDAVDLARVLETLANSEKRSELGTCGARRMAENFSWQSIARRRLQDYAEDRRRS